MKYKITVKQNGESKTINVKKGDNLLEVLTENNYELKTYCGGKGLCGKCKVKIISGNTQLNSKEKELLTEKEINENIRLACLTTIEDDLTLELENEDKIVAMTAGSVLDIEKDLLFKKNIINLKEATIEDQRDFLTKIYDFLNVNKITLNSLKSLNNIDFNQAFTVTSMDDQIIEIEEGKNKNDIYGIAVDIGTTTIVIYLINLNTEEIIDIYSLYNPQKQYGADVISRINYTIDNDDGINKLQDVLKEGLNKGIDHLVENTGIKVNEILQGTIVGNTVMMHTILGMEIETIANSPFIPMFTNNFDFNARELGININQNGIIQLLPSISAYVGADIIGDMLAANINTYNNKTNLLIDIGTNGEIVLNHKDQIYTCSTAAGPAFEGANITFGMAGIPGAISKFEINKGKIKYTTIGDEKPKGICGSGLLDIIAVLFENGLIDNNGSFVNIDNDSDPLQNRFTKYKGKNAFIIAKSNETDNSDPILLTQKDIREVQLAKGAIQAGINILLKEINIDENNVDHVYLAGGFGNYLNPHNACILGLIPKVLEEKIIRIGNGAGSGAQMYLLDKKTENYVDVLKNNVKYIELSSKKEFQNEYMASMQF